MDPFQALPVELILSILHHTADFLGVDSLLQVSPRVRALFQAQSAQITEDLLATCPSTAHELHQLFRTVALIHTPSFRPDNLKDFDAHSSSITSLIDESPARLTIQIAAQIQRLACACLLTSLQRFKAAHGAILPPEWHDNGSGPFSWVEEFRVHRTIWRLRIYSDLCQAASINAATIDSDPNGRGRWNWHRKETAKIANHFHEYQGRMHEIHTVADLLRQLGAPLTYADTLPPKVWRELDVFPQFASLHVPDLDKYPTWHSPSIPDDTDDNLHLGRSVRDTKTSPHGLYFNVTLRANYFSVNGLDGTAFHDVTPWYPLGVFLWDTWRMYCMGLCNLDTRESVRAPDGTSFTPALTEFAPLLARWVALVERYPWGRSLV